MKKIILTGSEGFVGKHFVQYFNDNDLFEILGLDVFTKTHKTQTNYKYLKMDLQNYNQLSSVINSYRPDYLVHLAAFSSVAQSWTDPESCFRNNTDIFINILEAVRKYCIKCRILSVGSSEEYGNVIEESLPVNEETPLLPNSPYAVARVSQEMLSKIYVEGYGLDIVLTRSFNHIGPGQNTKFAIPAFVERIINAKDNIKVGNLSAIRDFTDVRDVVKAYRLLLEKGISGEVYNVCSGKGYKLEEIVEMIKSITEKSKIKNEIDSDLIRPIDLPKMIGDNGKLKDLTSWFPEITIEQSLNDIVEYYSRKIR